MPKHLQRAKSGDVTPNREMDAMHMRVDGRKESTTVLVAAKFLATTPPAALVNAICFVRICMVAGHTKQLANLHAKNTQPSYQVG